MSNMSYCRFENTYQDLEDCRDHINDTGISPIESDYRSALVALCKEIVDTYRQPDTSINDNLTINEKP